MFVFLQIGVKVYKKVIATYIFENFSCGLACDERFLQLNIVCFQSLKTLSKTQGSEVCFKSLDKCVHYFWNNEKYKSETTHNIFSQESDLQASLRGIKSLELLYIYVIYHIMCVRLIWQTGLDQYITSYKCSMGLLFKFLKFEKQGLIKHGRLCLYCTAI